jgi:DNA-binding GntR family transcriptional regulator
LDSLEQRNLPERVADHLLEQVTSGEIKLGTRILEVPLSEKLGVARSTLREGLRLLEARGVVTATPQKGLTVRIYDPESIKTIYALRGTTELRACSLLLSRPEKVQPLISTLDSIIDSMGRYQGKSNPTLNRLDIAFHTALVDAAGEFALTSIWGAVKYHLAIIFSLEISDSSNFAEEHRQLVKALANGEWSALEATYRLHIAKDRLDVE